MPKFTINSTAAKQACIAHIESIDMGVKPIMDVEILPFKKTRSLGQNSLMWGRMMSDFSTQGIIEGRQYSIPAWHEHLKRNFLPDHYEEGITKKNYIKWLELPLGQLELKGSTTQLTTTGFSQYLERCYAYGAEELEIRFSQ